MRIGLLALAVALGGCGGCGEVGQVSALGADASAAEPDDAGIDGAVELPDASLELVCGDGVRAPPELCDGDCPTSCDDRDACTTDPLGGTAARCDVLCTHVVSITACANDDGCCAAGCTRSSDNDCPYHVDSRSGDDSRDGLTPATAWKTLAKVNATTFVAGDRIALKRGEVWHEPLVITSAGTKARPIVFTAYGAGSARPVIAPTTTVTGWSAAGDSRWVADVAGPVRQLFVDGVRVPVARHPNQGYLYADSNEAQTSTSFLDAALTATREDLVGATLIVRAVRWSYDVRTVVGFADHRISFDSPVRDWGSIEENEGYILANKLWMLDSPGEWVFDEMAKKLYLRLPDDSEPAAHVVEFSSATIGIHAKTARGLVLEGLAVRQADVDGIRLSGPEDTRVQDCAVENVGGTGIAVSGPPAGASVQVVDNLVQGSAFNGITISANEVNPAQVVVARNQILDTMVAFPTVNRAAPYSGGMGYAATVYGNSTRFENNVIRSAGYDGTLFGGNSHHIAQNYFERCCLLLDDCGGIYLGGGHHVVKSNVLVDMVGNAEGTASFFTDQGTAAQGIYPDDRSHDVRIEDNTVVNADFGVQVHNSYNNTILRNHIFGSRGAGLFFSEDGIVNVVGYVHDNVSEENVIVSVNGAFSVEEVGVLGVVDFGTFDRNQYWHPQGRLPINRSVKTGATWQTRAYTLDDWRATTGNDVHSTDLAQTFVVVPSTGRPSGAELIKNGAFGTGVSDWSAWPGSVELGWSAACGLTGGCLQATNAPPADGALVSSPSFAVTQGKGYLVTFGAKASGRDVLAPVVRRASSPYDSLGLFVSVPVAETRADFTFAFVATGTATGRLDLGLPKTITVQVDDVSLKEATVFKNDPADDARILLNPGVAPKAIDLQGQTWCGVDGRVVSGQVTLAPYSSRILVACQCNGDFECNNQETKASCAQDCD